jgi:hypothetical protein
MALEESCEEMGTSMVAWKRFPIPEFNHDEFKDMAYAPSTPLSPGEAAAMAEKCRAGNLDLFGGYVVMPPEPLFERLNIRGEFRHAVMCLLPPGPVHLLGRSWAWKIQRALVVDSLEAETATILHEWKTPRPMNTRLGPDDGVALTGGTCYVITANKFADHWLGNRSIVDRNWIPGAGRKGFRILGSSDPEVPDFHHTYLAFEWPG